MLAITKTLVNKGVLIYQIKFDKLHNGNAFIFLDKNETLNKTFFERLNEVEDEYGANAIINYSQKHDCIVIMFC